MHLKLVKNDFSGIEKAVTHHAEGFADAQLVIHVRAALPEEHTYGVSIPQTVDGLEIGALMLSWGEPTPEKAWEEARKAYSM